jgi:hypothetical protein
MNFIPEQKQLCRACKALLRQCDRLTAELHQTRILGAPAGCRPQRQELIALKIKFVTNRFVEIICVRLDALGFIRLRSTNAAMALGVLGSSQKNNPV